MKKLSISEFSGVLFWVLFIAGVGATGSWVGEHGWTLDSTDHVSAWHWVSPSSFGTAGEWTAGAAALGAIQAVRIEARKNDEAREADRTEREADRAEQLRTEGLGKIRHLANRAQDPSGEWGRKLARLDEEFEDALSLAECAHLADIVGSTDLVALRLPKDSRFHPEPTIPTFAVAIAAELRKRIRDVVDDLAVDPTASPPEPETGDLLGLHAEIEEQIRRAKRVNTLAQITKKLSASVPGSNVPLPNGGRDVAKLAQLAVDAIAADLQPIPDHVQQKTIDAAKAACVDCTNAKSVTRPLLENAIGRCGALLSEWMDGTRSQVSEQ